MSGSLAVVWQDWCDEPPAHGRLELRSGRIHLEGMRSGRPISEDVALEKITSARFGRAAEERIRDRQTLVLDFVDRHRRVLISSLFGVGGLSELAEALGC